MKEGQNQGGTKKVYIHTLTDSHANKARVIMTAMITKKMKSGASR